MAFQVDLTTAQARKEVAKLNQSIDQIASKLDSASGAAARLSSQMQNQSNPFKTLTTSVISLNETIKRTATNWAKVSNAGAGSSDAMMAKVKLLQKEVRRLRNEMDKSKESNDRLNGSMKLGTQQAAAFRAAMYASHTHMGMFTANTLAAATATYALVAAIRGIVSTGAEFTKAIAATSAILMVSRDEMAGLESQILRLAEGTKYTATEVADASTVLARTGMNMREISQSLGAVLNLASIGAMDMAEASDIASNTMHGFGLEAKDLARVVDVLAFASVNSNTNVKQLGTAMSYAAPVAAAAGAKLEDVAAIMAVMADNGIKASRAGTAVRRAYVNLMAPTGKIKDTLDSLGVSTRKNTGEMKSMVDIMREMVKSGANEADLTKIFGARAVAGWAAVWKDLAGEVSGAGSKIAEFERRSEEMNGTAEKMRAAMEDNLIDIWAKFKSAISVKAVEAFKAMEGSLKSVLVSMTNFIIESDGLSEMAKSLGSGISSLINFIVEYKDEIGNVLQVLGEYLAVKKLLIPVLSSMATGFLSIRTAAIAAGSGMGALKVALSFINPITAGVLALVAAWELAIQMRDKYSASNKAFEESRQKKKEFNAKVGPRIQIAYAENSVKELQAQYNQFQKALDQAAANPTLVEPAALDNIKKMADAKREELQAAIAELDKLRGKLAEKTAWDTEAEKIFAEMEAFEARPYPEKQLKPVYTRPITDGPSESDLKKERRQNAQILSEAFDHQNHLTMLKSEGLKRDLEMADWAYAEEVVKANAKWTELGIAEQTQQQYRLAMEQEYLQAKLKLHTDYWDELFGLETGTSQAMFDFTKALKDGEYKAALSYGQKALSGAAKQSKEMFEIQKTLALANVAVTLPDAIMKSWDNAGGYPWGIIPAGLMAAAGIAQIQAINATSFGSKPKTPSAGGGGGSVPSPSASQLPATAGTGASGTTITVNIGGNVIGNEEFVNNILIPEIRTAVSERDELIITQDSRQALALKF